MMILDQLARICHEIRIIDHQFELPPHAVDGELTAWAITEKKNREEHLAATLFYAIKKYALQEKEVTE